MPSSRGGWRRTGSPSPSTAGATPRLPRTWRARSATAGGTAEAFVADVTDEDAVAGLVAEVAERLGPIDVLVLNATGPQPSIPLDDASWDDHLAQLHFFVRSPILLGRAVVPGMRERRWGRIVHVDSEVADKPPPGHERLRDGEERADRRGHELGARARARTASP